MNGFQAIEWASAVLLAVSIFWYPAVRGWKRVAAPLLGMVGCAGFFFVTLSADALSGGVAALNGGLALVNLWNAVKALRELRSAGRATESA